MRQICGEVARLELVKAREFDVRTREAGTRVLEAFLSRSVRSVAAECLQEGRRGEAEAQLSHVAEALLSNVMAEVALGAAKEAITR